MGTSYFFTDVTVTGTSYFLTKGTATVMCFIIFLTSNALQFINLVSSPNNRQDFQHPCSSLASKNTTKEKDNRKLIIFFSSSSSQHSPLDASQPDRFIVQQ